MPYALHNNCVINSATGEQVKCHPTRARALAHLRALMANVPEAKAQAEGTGAPKMTRSEAARHAALVRYGKEHALAQPSGGMTPAIAARVQQILAEKAAKGKKKAKGGKGKAKAAAPKKTEAEKQREKQAKLEERAKAKAARDMERTGKQAAREQARKEKQAAAEQQKQAKAGSAKQKAKEKAKAAVARQQAHDKAKAERTKAAQDKAKERAAAPAKQQADNRAKVTQDMADQDAGLAPGGAAALNDFADGKPLKPDAADSLEKMGLVEKDDQGAARLTTEGRAAATAMSKGDTRATLDAISRAGQKKRTTTAGKAIDMDALKAGARHSATDQKHIQAIHDSAVACGADCGMEDGAMDGAAEDAMKSMMDDPGYYAQHECGDVMQASQALALLCSLTMSELAEEDDDPTDIGQLVDAARILVKFISDELDELEEYATQDAEEDQSEGETDNVPQPMMMKAVTFDLPDGGKATLTVTGTTDPTTITLQNNTTGTVYVPSIFGVKAIGKREDVSAADKQRAVAEYGDVTYADEKNKKYPLDTEEHIRAANSYIGQAKNQAMYSPAEVDAIKKKIAAAWKKKIDPAGPPSAGKMFEEVYGSAIKALDGDTIGGYAVLFGTADTPDMSSQRDFFTKSTDFWLDRFGWPRAMTYHHGLDPDTRDDPIVGTWTKAAVDDVGVWLEGQLDKAHRYHTAIKELVKRGYLKLSSDSAPQWVVRTPVGDANEVKRWPLITASPTVTPAEPRLAGISFKALLADLGLEGIDDSPEAPIPNATRPDAVKVAADDRARRLLLELSILDMETAL